MIKKENQAIIQENQKLRYANSNVLGNITDYKNKYTLVLESQKATEDKNREILMKNGDLERDLINASKEVRFANDQIRSLERALVNKEDEVNDLERQLLELKDSKLGKSQQLNQVNQELMEKVQEYQTQLKKEQVEKFKLNEKLMDRESLILKLESERQNLKYDNQKKIGYSQHEYDGLLKALGLDKESDVEHGIKKLRKQSKLCNKLNRLITEVEGKKPDSLSNSLRWVKGLLHDFIE